MVVCNDSLVDVRRDPAGPLACGVLQRFGDHAGFLCQQDCWLPLWGLPNIETVGTNVIRSISRRFVFVERERKAQLSFGLDTRAASLVMTLLHPILVLLCLLVFNLPLGAALYPTQLIYQFPNGTFVENIAVRPDGSLLTSLIIPSPDLYLIQPSSTKPNPQLVHRFENSTSVLGITEISSDTFIVAVTTLAGGPGQAAPGSSSLWRVSFSKPKSSRAKVSLFTKIPTVQTPNGLVTLNKHQILLADSAQGVVFAIDLDTGTSNIAITDPLFVNNGRPISVNGLKILGRILYFTNTAQNILGKVPINLKTSAARGPASVVVDALAPAKGYGDFALAETGIAYATNAAGNFVERVNLNSKQQTIIAGQINSTEIAEPTAAALGRNGKEDVLFVTTGGGLLIPVNGDEIVGGQIVAIKLGRKY